MECDNRMEMIENENISTNPANLVLTNVDEDGNEIENIDWSKWTRIRVGEILDETENVVKLISYCRKLTEEELNERLLSALKATENEDIQAALCDIAEQQAAYESDVNAALCELYELIAGGEEDAEDLL